MQTHSTQEWQLFTRVKTTYRWTWFLWLFHIVRINLWTDKNHQKYPQNEKSDHSIWQINDQDMNWFIKHNLIKKVLIFERVYLVSKICFGTWQTRFSFLQSLNFKIWHNAHSWYNCWYSKQKILSNRVILIN